MKKLCIDHINDHRYRTLGPVTVEAEVDIFTTGISVDPTFGEFEEDLRRRDEERRVVSPVVQIPSMRADDGDIQVIARISIQHGTREIPKATVSSAHTCAAFRVPEQSTGTTVVHGPTAKVGMTRPKIRCLTGFSKTFSVNQ